MKTILSSRDREILAFALNLEFLQAELYLRAATGEGLTAEERANSSAPCIGGHKIEFAKPWLAAVVREFGEGERCHVRLLQSMITDLGEAPLASPAIDLADSFAKLLKACGLVTPPRTFNAFINETNFLLAAYIIEDVVVSSYRYAVRSIADGILRDHFAGILASEASQSAIIRMTLLAGGFGDMSNAIAYHRQVLSEVDKTAYAGNDHGVGSSSSSGVVNADGNFTIWPRSERQVLNILCGGLDHDAGLFFPDGFVGVKHSACLREIFVNSLQEMAGKRDAQIAQVTTVPSETVYLPELGFDEETLSRHQIRENVSHQPFSEKSYASIAPLVVQIDDVISHGAVGIVTIDDDRIIHETVWHTDPDRHNYSRCEDSIRMTYWGEEFIAGLTVSILVGAAESYWHSMLDATARLTLISNDVWVRAKTLLIPSTGIRQLESVEIFGIPEHVTIRSVKPGEVLRLEQLAYPSSIHGLFDYQPTLLSKFYERMSANTPAKGVAQTYGPYIYLDRRKSKLRKLRNEEQLIAALPDFMPVLLEERSVAEQIEIFRSAKIVIAPHGAGLTNIGFCTSGTIIIELMMDEYCNWCYRRIAAIRGLKYVCVLGRASVDTSILPSIHHATWDVDVDSVLKVVSCFV